MSESSPTVAVRHAPSWLQLEHVLGTGGMGTVYAAVDRRTGERVAVKTLHEFGAKELLCLKNEFRSFADVAHPNLISQHELVENEGEWFLLMELLQGGDLLAYVRRLPSDRQSATSPSRTTGKTDPTATVETTPARLAELAASSGSLHKHAVTDVERTRAIPVLRQLALGLDAIHQAGFVHRDIKPSNVLVSEDGRAVLLDFGIAVAQHAARAAESGKGTVVGTPAFLAPELLRGVAASSASDWYSFGLMMFETFVGQRAFGPTLSMTDRLTKPLPAVHSLAPDVAGELAELIDGLLHTEPTSRPTFERIIAVLGGAASERADARTSESEFVGRVRERTRLKSLAVEAKQRPVSLFVRGRSGAGKSVLLDHVLAELEAGGRVVLRGRCYEQELVPYKTVDKLVDGLAGLLERRKEWVTTLTPSDAPALVRAFPVLSEVWGHVPGPTVTGADAVDLQRRAIEALSSVFKNLAANTSLVLCVDDLQWGDRAGAEVLARLANPSSQPVLVLGGYRAEDAESANIATLRGVFLREVGSAPEELVLEPLGATERLELATHIAREAGVTDPQTIQWAVNESEGQPFFLHELLYGAAQSGVGSLNLGRGLLGVVAARVAKLPEDARRLLQVVALAGAVVPQDVANHASGVHAARLYQLLRARHFIRTTSHDGGDLVDTYHDKFREVVKRELEVGAAEEIHFRLIDAWKRTPDSADRRYVLSHHASLAGERVTPEQAFELHRDAALQAVTTFDSSRAREFLLRAQAARRRLGTELPTELELQLGNLCIANNDVSGARAAFDLVLATSKDRAHLAGAHAGLAKLAMSILDTKSGLREATHALEMVGLPPVRASIFSLAGALLRWGGTLVRRWVLGSSPPRPGDELQSSLYSTSGFAGYFLFDPKLLVGGLIRSLVPLSRLPFGRAHAEAYGFASVVSSVIGLKGLTTRVLSWAKEAAVSAKDPTAAAFVAGFGAMAVDMGGAPLEGERDGIAAVERGARLDVSTFLTLVSGVSWNLVMRGQARKTFGVLRHGVQRVESMGLPLATHGHTFRIYFGVVQALLGDPHDGAAQLESYRTYLDTSAPDDSFRRVLLLGHRALFLHLTGASDAAIEALLAEHAAFHIKPQRHVQTLRQVYLAAALHRGHRLLRDGTRDDVRSAARATIADLGVLGRYPTTVLHRELLTLRLAGAEGVKDTAALKALVARAAQQEAPWLELEGLLTEAAWLPATAPERAQVVERIRRSVAEAELPGLLVSFGRVLPELA